MSMSLVCKTESLYVALELAMWTRAGLELTDIHLSLSSFVLGWGGVKGVPPCPKCFSLVTNSQSAFSEWQKQSEFPLAVAGILTDAQQQHSVVSVSSVSTTLIGVVLHLFLWQWCGASF